MDMANVTVTISRDAGDTRDYYVSLNCSNVTCDETGPFFPGANGNVLPAYSNSVVGAPTVATITETLNGQVTASMR
ncbi:MAG TPA: hypothetical protein VM912_15635 [Terriglobales bacterium]|nr:hypothetical protein [Terriglobales bacterium]